MKEIKYIKALDKTPAFSNGPTTPMEIGTNPSGISKKYWNCGLHVCTLRLFLMQAVYMSEIRDPSVVACPFHCLRSVEYGSPLRSPAACGDAGRSAAAPETALSAPPRWVTSGRCCLALQSPAPREQHPTGRRAPHAGSLRTWKKGQAQSRPRSSDAATNHGGVSPGGANVEPAKPPCGPAAPRPPRLGCPLPGRGGEPWLVQSLSASCCPAAGLAPS